MGSRMGKRPNLQRDLQRLYANYLSHNPRYLERDFERRFRMSRSVFDRICSGIVGEGIFARRTDRLGKKGIHPLQRVIAALRMLTYV